MLKNSSTLAVSVPINISIKLGFVPVNLLCGCGTYYNCIVLIRNIMGMGEYNKTWDCFGVSTEFYACHFTLVRVIPSPMLAFNERNRTGHGSTRSCINGFPK